MTRSFPLPSKAIELSERGRLYGRMFGLAGVAHVVGNWSLPDLPSAVGWVNLLVALFGLILAARPERWLLVVVGGLVVTSSLLEIPVTGNHWIVAGLVGLAIVATAGSERRWIPTSRWILLVFYSFAAFAKLNSGFFDPSVSCAVFYANQTLAGWGLSPVEPTSAAASLAIWSTVAIELSVPILLLLRRTRLLGVVVGSAFHTLISFDLNQHFYDFTSVLLALFVLFLPDSSIERIRRIPERISGPERRTIGLVAALVLFGLVMMAISPLTPTTAQFLARTPFISWIPFSLGWVIALISARAPSTALEWRPGLAGGVVILLTVVNGLTPYTEVKTGYSFNMYANLLTAGGESNHFLIPRTIELRDYELVEIVESSDDGLISYRDQGYLIATPSLRRYLSTRLNTELSIRTAAGATTVVGVGDDPSLFDPGPWWWRFLPIRAVDVGRPPRCQAAFLPAL